jgi:hypothetical protein
MDIIQLYEDYGLDYKMAGEHKHARDGFVNVECPFCTGNPGYHLSFNLEDEYFVCWRCGWKPIDYVIVTLCECAWSEAQKIIKQYGGEAIITTDKEKKYNTEPFKLPSNTETLKKIHRNYLIDRGFDPDKLIRDWSLLGTLGNSKLKTEGKIIDYRFRVVLPFFWNNKMVSFDARDITGKAMNKYQACPLAREVIPHKDIIYGRQDKWKSTCIVVEGPSDVWRFGFNSGATSGIQFTTQQVRYLSKTFRRCPVCYDGNELQAREQADALVAELKFRGVDSFRVDIEGDPGGMEQKEADYLVKQLIK